MKIKIQILLITLLINLPLFGAKKYDAPKWLTEKISKYDIDPEDTLDEEELLAIRDTMYRSRKNLAIESGTVNAMDYLLDDRYFVSHDTFIKGWLNNIYVGIGAGFDYLKPRSAIFKMKTLTHINGMLGKQITPRSGVRLSLAQAWGFQDDKEKWMFRSSAKLDYIFDFTSNLIGYNSGRKINVSAILGAGGSMVRMQHEKMIFAPEGHLGLQFKLATGANGYFNIEPYGGITIDNIGNTNRYSWRAYDFFWGINLNYTYFITDHLSEDAVMKRLRQRAEDDRVIDPHTTETWRTPWFVGVSTGASMGGADNVDFSKTLGHQTKLTFGRWLSPVIGLRLSALTRTSTWHNNTSEPTEDRMGFVHSYSTNSVVGQAQALFNPFGFFKSFNWDNNFGMFIAFGGSGGKITKYLPGSKMLRTYSQSYDVGLQFWSKLSEDLHFFIEPEFSHIRYVSPYRNVPWNKMFNDNMFSVNMGVSLMIRSYKFHELNTMDRMQNYTYRDIKGFRVGLAGGMTLMQTRNHIDNNGGFKWSGMAYGEYRFNFLHSVRLQEDVLAVKENNVKTYRDVYAMGTPDEVSVTRKGVWCSNSTLALTSLDYEISLTNLASGHKRYRLFDLEGYAGPTFGFVVSNKETINPNEPIRSNEHTIVAPGNNMKKTMFGMNLGVKLSTQVAKGLSVVVMPTAYLLDSDNLGNTICLFSKMHFYQSLNIGVQYKIGAHKSTAAKKQTRFHEKEHEWNRKLIESNANYQKKMEKKVEKKRKKYAAKRTKRRAKQNRKY